MPTLSNDQTTLHVTRLNQCSGWTEWMLPLIQQRALSMMENMLAGKSDGDERAKGFIQALRWVIALPKTTLDDVARSETEAATGHEVAQQDEFRARFGNRSPFRAVPEGETKQDEALPTSAA